MLGGFATLLLDPRVFPDRHGVAYLLGAIVATVAYDVGGYAFGSWLGSHRLAPSISPNKTWEGLLGGCFTAVAISVAIVHRMHPWTLAHALELGAVVAVFAPLGDLVESMVKRDIGVKDMGTLLPAHGGMLDRVDSLLFVLPATYCLVRLFHG
jgi:phosphatidate cytidylyltransferase